MWKLIASHDVLYYGPFFMFPFRCEWKWVHSCVVISISGVFCRVVWEEIDSCICAGGFWNMLITILGGFWIRNRSKKYICPLSSCVGLSFMTVCIWFILVVIRSECIFLGSYVITISFTQHMYNVTFLVSRICFIWLCSHSSCVPTGHHELL